MLSDSQRRKLEKEKNELEKQHELLFNKIAGIKRDRITATDASVIFKYDDDIDKGETNLEEINSSLNGIEKQLRDDEQLRNHPNSVDFRSYWPIL